MQAHTNIHRDGGEITEGTGEKRHITEKLPRKATAVLFSLSYPLDCNRTPPVSVEVGVGASGGNDLNAGGLAGAHDERFLPIYR